MNSLSRLGRGALIALGAGLLGAGCDVHDLVDHLGCCGGGCGREVTHSYDLADFDELDCRAAFDVTVRQGGQHRVTVTVAEDIEDDLVVRRDGNRLRLDLDNGHACGERRAVIEMPALRRVEARDVCRVRLEGPSSGGAVALDLSAASSVEGDLSASAIALRLSGASRADLAGATDQLDLDASGASRADLGDLAAIRAVVTLDGASWARVRVSEWLDVVASGASTLRYIGHPRLGRVDLSGGSHLDPEE
jgi:hypothetical protein